MRFLTDLVDSAKSALKLGNILKRIFLFFMFAFFLGLTKLISSLDQVTANGGGFVGVYKATIKAMYYGIGVAHATIFEVITNWSGYWNPIAGGTIAITVILTAMLIGFYFQPISFFINLFDSNDQKSTGDKYGRSPYHGIVSFMATIMFILIISIIVGMTGTSESIAGGGQEFAIVNESINATDTFEIIPNEVNESINDTTKIVNSINMFT